MRKFLKLGLLSIISVVLVNATILYSIDDGWDSSRDVLASSTDQITFTGGSLVTHRFTFNTSSSDVLCLKVNAGFDRSANYIMDGTKVPLLNMYNYYEEINGGVKETIQERAGSGTTCRYFFWVNRPSVCDGIFLATGDAAAYTAIGCTPNATGSMVEGAGNTHTFNGRSYQIFCADAIADNYVKCQADTIANMWDCIDDSQADIVGDDKALFETCEDNINSGIDTAYACDLSHTLPWGISWGNTNFYTDQQAEQWINGMPNTSFSLYSYTACGTGITDRDLVGTYSLTQLMNKKVVCDGNTAFNASGEVWGYKPWFGVNGFFNYTYTYGAGACISGTGAVCTEEYSTSNVYDLNGTACVVNAGTCYDGIKNRDETSKDYGGICGMCDNTTLSTDLYYDVARQSYPSGYFDIHAFDNSTFCPEAEESVDFSVIIASFIGVTVMGFLVLILGVLSVYLFSTGAAIWRFFRRKKEKNLSKLNNKKGI